MNKCQFEILLSYLSIRFYREEDRIQLGCSLAVNNRILLRLKSVINFACAYRVIDRLLSTAMLIKLRSESIQLVFCMFQSLFCSFTVERVSATQHSVFRLNRILDSIPTAT